LNLVRLTPGTDFFVHTQREFSFVQRTRCKSLSFWDVLSSLHLCQWIDRFLVFLQHEFGFEVWRLVSFQSQVLFCFTPTCFDGTIAPFVPECVDGNFF